MKTYFRYLIAIALVALGLPTFFIGITFSDEAITISGAIFLCTGANMFFSLLK